MTIFADISLKPCPFCGGESTLDGYKSGGNFAGCINEFDNCPVQAITEAYDTPEEAANAWNRREA